MRVRKAKSADFVVDKILDYQVTKGIHAKNSFKSNVSNYIFRKKGVLNYRSMECISIENRPMIYGSALP